MYQLIDEGRKEGYVSCMNCLQAGSWKHAAVSILDDFEYDFSISECAN